MEDDVQTIKNLISRYHQALADRDWDTAHACFDRSRFRLAGNGSDEPDQWSAVGFFTEEEIRVWERDLPKTFVYQNQIEFGRIDVRNNLGLALTRETGHSQPDTAWENKNNIWFTAKIDGDWKILGSLHRDDRLWSAPLE